MGKEIHKPEEKEPKKEEKKDERPYMGYKKELLLEMCEKHRDLLNDNQGDKEYHKKKITEIENELKQR